MGRCVSQTFKMSVIVSWLQLREFIAVLAIVLGSSLHLSIAADNFNEQGAAQVIYVRPNSKTGTHGCTPFFNNTCNCSSLEDGLKKAKLLASMRQPIKVVLAPSPTDNCTVRTTKINFFGLHFETLTIHGQEGGECCGKVQLEASYLNVSRGADHRALSSRTNLTAHHGLLLICITQSSGITFSNILFKAPANWTMITVRLSSRIAFDHDNFSLDTLSVALKIVNSRETVVQNCTFAGANEQSNAMRTYGAVTVRFDKDSSLIRKFPLYRSRSKPVDFVNFTDGGYDVIINNCTFRQLGGASYAEFETKPENSGQPSGSALNITFGGGARGWKMLVNFSEFADNDNPRDSAVFALFQMGAGITTGNNVSFSRCKFTKNKGLLGGALRVLFARDRVMANTIYLTKCVFKENRARQLGGAMFIRFAEPEEGAPRGNSIHLVECEFLSNGAGMINAGDRPAGAVYVTTYFNLISNISQYTQSVSEFDRHMCTTGPKNNWYSDTPTIPLKLSRCVFANNTGLGVFFARRTHALFDNATTFEANGGTAVVAARAKVIFKDELTIASGRGACGGAFRIQEHSQVDMQEVSHLNLTNNTAKLAGCLFWADRSSSSVVLDKLLGNTYKPRDMVRCPIRMPKNFPLHARTDLLAQGGRCGKICNATIYFGSWHSCYDMMPVRVKSEFRNNSQNLSFCPPYIKSPKPGLKGDCSQNGRVANKPWANGDRVRDIIERHGVCQSTCLNITVYNDIDVLESSVMTKPSWLFFNSSSTECFKVIDGHVWYFTPRCSREKVVKYAAEKKKDNSTFPASDCHLFRLSTSLLHYNSSLTPVLPGYRLTLTPWASHLVKWDSYHHLLRFDGFKERVVCSNEEEGDTPLPLNSISNLTLHPAPGEVFNLTVVVADELFNEVPSAVTVELMEGHSGEIRLYHNFRPVEKVTYSSTQPLSSLSLTGKPGMSGYLRVIVTSRTNLLMSSSKQLLMRIHFRLRDCHLGFKLTNLHQEKESEKLEYSCMCQAGKIAGAQDCYFGRQLMISDRYWAGDLNSPLVQSKSPYRDTTENFFHASNTHGLAFPKDSKLVVSLCNNGWCQRCERGWMFPRDNPCDEHYGHIGPLCGTCPLGKSWALGYPECHTCEGKTTISIGTYFILLFLGVALLFVFLLVLNVGITPTLDSSIFFIHAAYCIFRTVPSIRKHYIGVTSLGLSYFCKEPSLTTPQDCLLQIFQPVVLLFLIGVVWLLARNAKAATYLQQLQKRKSLLHVLWFIMLVAYTNITFVSMGLLACVPLGDSWVLHLDGSVKCFEGDHLPFGIIGVIILVVFVIPPPILLLWPRVYTMPRLKGLMDEAMHIYSDDRRWWVSVNLFRRLLISAMSVWVPPGYPAQVAVTTTLLALLLAQDFIRPYHRNKWWKLQDVDNHFEFLLLVNLVVLSLLQIVMLGINESKPLIDFSILALFVFPTLIFLLAATYQFGKSWWQTVSKKPASLKEVYGKNALVDDDRFSVCKQSDETSFSEGRRRVSKHKSSCFSGLNSVRGLSGLRDPLLLDELRNDKAT